MTDLLPFARLWDLTSASDVPLATSATIVDFEITYALDAVGTLRLEFGAGDPGDGTTTSFAAALLQAASDLGSAPVPLLLEFSLDGGRAYDSRKMVEQPERALKASERTIKEDGPDLGSILTTVPVERVTFTDCRLADVFNGNPDHAPTGAIVPLAPTGLAAGAIPYLYGLLTVTPGRAGWSSGARLTWTGVVDPAIEATATNVDVDSATTLAACEAIVNRLAGAALDGSAGPKAPDQRYGHYVADPSDAALNVGGHDRSFVVGNIGNTARGGDSTTAHLVFDATGNEDVDETTTARLHLDSATLRAEDVQLYHACNFVGGSSTAGFPDGSKVTGLTVLNGTTGLMSSTRDAWQDGVPVVGINVNDSSGGLFFTILDGQIRPIPGSPATACQSIGVDAGRTTSPTRAGALLMGSPHGVYLAENADLLTGQNTNSDGSFGWVLLGDLAANVTRINVEIDPSDQAHRVVFAFVKGSGEREDGVYRWTHNTGDSNPLAGTWNPVLINSNLVDMIATDYLTFWVIKKADQTRIYRYAVGTGAPSPTGGFALPSGEAYHLQEVVTAAHGSGMSAVAAQDSVWALCSGASQSGVYTPAFYLVYNTGTSSWDGFYNANVDGSLVGPGSAPLQLNRVVGLGISFDGVYATAFAGTDQGVYFSTATLGGNLAWTSANEQGGLANYNVKSIAAPEYQVIMGTQLNRIYCTTEDDLLSSSSSGRWWETVKGRDRTTAGPHLSSITVTQKGTLPHNFIRSWGSTTFDGSSMVTSPIGAADSTHVYVDEHGPDVIPAGYYVERYLDQHLDFQYRLVAQPQVCPFPGVQMEQLPSLQSNAAVDADRASAGVLTVAKRWLPQHATPQTQLVCESSFSTQEAALRTTRPTHVAHVNGAVTITDISSAGAALTTRVWEADNAPMYVLAHSIKKGPGMTAITTTTLGTQLLATPTTAADMANALTDALASLKVWR